MLLGFMVYKLTCVSKNRSMSCLDENNVTRVYKHRIGSAKPDTFFDRYTLSKARKNVPL